MEYRKEDFISVYDVFAILLHKIDSTLAGYLKGTITGDPSDRISNRKNDNIDSFINEIKRQNNGDLNQVSRNLASKGIHKGSYNDIIAILDKSSNCDDYYGLLHKLAEIIKMEHVFTFLKKNSNTTFECLNGNKCETGFMILPLVRSMNNYVADTDEPNRWDGDYREFINFYYIKCDELSLEGREFQIRNHIFADKEYDNSGFVFSDQGLTVSASPITCGKTINVEKLEVVEVETAPGNSIKAFNVPPLEDDTKALIKERIKAAFKAAADRKTDILFFPEMLGDEETFGGDWWRSLYFSDEIGSTYPQLIISPSWWRDRINEVSVFDNSGKRLFSQKKFYPFSDKIRGDLLIENIETNSGEHVVHILHVPYVGRMVVMICKDFLTTDYRRMITDALRATLLIVPSYSPGTTQFDNQDFNLISSGCYCFWLNTCSAQKQEKLETHVFNITSPLIIIDAENALRQVDILKKCGNNCGNNIDVCLFTARVLPNNEGSNNKGRRIRIDNIEHVFGNTPK